MSFAAFTSAMVVRQGTSPDWRHFQLPPILYFNTLVLLTSSITLELSRRRMVGARGLGLSIQGLSARGLHWFHVTVVLGLLFVVGQVLAWRALAARGLFVATNPSSSFFYVFTVLHALHLVGGIGGLLYVRRRSTGAVGRAPMSALGAVSLYWHFMDVLWLYLLLILTFLV